MGSNLPPTKKQTLKRVSAFAWRSGWGLNPRVTESHDRFRVCAVMTSSVPLQICYIFYHFEIELSILLKVCINCDKIIPLQILEKTMIAIIDYGAGNLSSVKKALDYLGAESEITHDRDKIMSASHIILPGVGSFGDAMCSMQERGLAEVVKEVAVSGKPFLGICLGLQLLFESSEESDGAEGLGLLKGKIVTIPRDMGLKVPHMGWNSISIKQNNGIFSGINENSYFYFVHSFYLKDAEADYVAATTQYGVEIECAVQKGNICATQFHPEKSGAVGLKLLENFINMEG